MSEHKEISKPVVDGIVSDALAKIQATKDLAELKAVKPQTIGEGSA
jgi:hypothetical protein